MRAGYRFEIGGGKEKWNVLETATDGGDYIAEIELTPGRGPPPHLHPHEDERLEILDGSLNVKLPTGKQILRKGDVITIAKGTRHRINAGADGVKMRFSYPGDRFERVTDQLPPGDSLGPIRMVQYAYSTGWDGISLGNPALNAVAGIVARVAWLFGVRPHA